MFAKGDIRLKINKAVGMFPERHGPMDPLFSLFLSNQTVLAVETANC